MRRFVVIGAGLAGLAAALRLAEAGVHVTVIARGAGSLNLSPGTIDVLGYSPGRVQSPDAAMADFLETRPSHPYGRLDLDVLREALSWFVDRVPALRYVGDGVRNLVLPSAVGVARPTAWAPASMAGANLQGGGRYVAVGLAALKDFFPRLLADNLERATLPDGGSVHVRHAEIAASPRPGSADVAAPVYARALDDRAFRATFADALREIVEDGETLLVPAVLGLTRSGEAWDEVQSRVGHPIAEVPTVPPSVGGMRLQREMNSALTRAGGRITMGPEVVGCTSGHGRITEVTVRDAARTRGITVDGVVLATGGFSAGGIELDSHGALHETALGLPVTGPPAGTAPLSTRHLDHQPLMASGVSVDAALRPVGSDGAAVWSNLRAAGSILAGAEPWREKSGEGIAIASGYAAAGSLLEEAT